MKLNTIFKQILTEERTDYNHREYLKWKRKNITIRGIKEVGEYNGSGAMLGNGLYTAFLSNKSLAKEYGKVYFVLNAIPKKPLIVNSLNEWEIWSQKHLYTQYGDKSYPDSREFFKHTTIRDAMLKLGYDGVIIKGREMVNYSPSNDNIKYFETERQLQLYYSDFIIN